jgi:hypothetical protein
MAILHEGMLRLASLVVPKSERREWLSEWTAELWYLLRGRGPARAAKFCCGAFHDALVVRSHSVVRSQSTGAGQWHNMLRLSNPGVCLAMLAVMAAGAALVMSVSPAVQASLWKRPIEAHIVLAAGAMLLYPMMPRARGFDLHGVRNWGFMAAKSVILIVIVFFASFDIVPVISRTQMQPQLTLVMYIMAFRWAVHDQRRRCPTCLRSLTNPVHIGHSAGTLLEWYGSEFMCPQGHGVLHEPELATSYCARRWVRLDASWRELFQ